MADDRLTADEVALVLRRAAELDLLAADPASEDHLPVAAVEAAAAEVGVPAAAVRQAVAELRAGVLVAGPSAAPAPTAVVEAAVVALPPTEALDRIGQWLAAQTLHRHRGREGVQVWRVREDWVATFQRAFDWSASVRLKDVSEVVVRAVPVEGGTLVRVEATLSGGAAVAPGVGAAGGAVTGSAVGMSGGLLFAGGPPSVMAVSAAVAGIGALGGWRLGRRFRRARADRVADELAAALDRLAAGDALVRRPLDRLRPRVRARGPVEPGHWV